MEWWVAGLLVVGCRPLLGSMITRDEDRQLWRGQSPLLPVEESQAF